MISAILVREENGFTACEVSGHSGYAESGSDIVCAAVSILTCTCVNALETVCGINTDETVSVSEEGYVSFRLPADLTKEENDKAQILMGALKQGLTDLSKDRPKYVRLIIKNGGKRK